VADIIYFGVMQSGKGFHIKCPVWVIKMQCPVKLLSTPLTPLKREVFFEPVLVVLENFFPQADMFHCLIAWEK
jgi:hypothetical protein